MDSFVITCNFPTILMSRMEIDLTFVSDKMNRSGYNYPYPVSAKVDSGLCQSIPVLSRRRVPSPSPCSQEEENNNYVANTPHRSLR